MIADVSSPIWATAAICQCRRGMRTSYTLSWRETEQPTNENHGMFTGLLKSRFVDGTRNGHGTVITVVDRVYVLAPMHSFHATPPKVVGKRRERATLRSKHPVGAGNKHMFGDLILFISKHPDLTESVTIRTATTHFPPQPNSLCQVCPLRFAECFQVRSLEKRCNCGYARLGVHLLSSKQALSLCA